MKIERTLSIMLFLCASGIFVKAQSPTQNYVMSKDVLDVDGTHAITTVTYYDGLGYPVETATNGLGGTGKYAYTLLEHDALGREKQSWLPGTQKDGCSFVAPSELSSSLITFHKDRNPYSVNNYDALDRQVSTLGAGESWHTAKKSVEQRKKGLYLFYLYDKMKRKVLLGTTTSINASCISALATYEEQVGGLCNSGYTPLGNFGLIDDLTYSYNGNQIKAISDKAGSLLYDGSFDFKDGANADVEYFYDANGALVKDLNKGISNIEYDVLGNFVLEDGKLSKYLFNGGYCSFDNNQNPTFHLCHFKGEYVKK